MHGVEPIGARCVNLEMIASSHLWQLTAANKTQIHCSNPAILTDSKTKRDDLSHHIAFAGTISYAHNSSIWENDPIAAETANKCLSETQCNKSLPLHTVANLILKLPMHIGPGTGNNLTMSRHHSAANCGTNSPTQQHNRRRTSRTLRCLIRPGLHKLVND